MSQTYCLDPVIREFSPDTKRPLRIGKKIAIDVDTGKVVEDGLFRRLRGRLKYYVVSADVNSVAECKLPVFHLKDFNQDLPVAFSGAYRVSCERGKEDQVAMGLHGTSHPGLVLEGLIQTWIGDYARERLPAFIKEFFTDRNLLRNDIKERAAQIGLQLDIRLKLEFDKHLDTIKIGPTDLPVRVGRFGEEQHLKITLHLDVDEDNREAAILNYSQQHSIKDRVMGQVKRFFADEVSLHDFLTKLNSETVSAGLVKRLNEFLKQDGRKVGALALESSAPPPPRNFRGDIEIVCNVQNYGAVIINNTIELSLVDSALYRTSGQQNLKAWAEATLETVITKKLFYKTYLNLLVDFEEIESDIRQGMVEESRALGYTIDHLISKPALDPIRWHEEGFTVKPIQEFQTKDPMVSAKLQIAVTARIPDLRKVSNYLNQNVPQLVETAVISRAALYLRGIDAQRYYMRFFQIEDRGKTDAGKSEGTREKPIVIELANEIREELERFSLEIIELNPLPLDTEITLRLKDLMKEVCSFQVEVTPFQGSQDVVITGALLIESVASGGWHSFKLRNFALADLRESVEKHLRSKLNGHPYEQLVYKTESGHEELFLTIKGHLDQFVQDAFGLDIRLLSVDRVKTFSEKGEGEVFENWVRSIIDANKHMDDEKLERLRLLNERRTALMTQTDVHDEAHSVDLEIRQVVASIQAAPGFATAASERVSISAGQSGGAERKALPEAPGDQS